MYIYVYNMCIHIYTHIEIYIEIETEKNVWMYIERKIEITPRPSGITQPWRLSHCPIKGEAMAFGSQPWFKIQLLIIPFLILTLMQLS